MSRLLLWMLRVSVLLCLMSVAVRGFAQENDTDALIAAVTSAAKPEIVQSLPAPEGSQRAEVTVYPCVAVDDTQQISYERLDVIDDAGEAHLVAEQVIHCGGLGAFGLSALRWSDDGGYLYYTDAREGTPDGGSAGWTPTLWRVQTADWQVERLGRARFSYDGKQIAAWDEANVRVMPTDASEEVDYPLTPAGLYIVEVIWLPDNSGLLYTQADTLFGPVSRSTVTHIDLSQQIQTVLLDTNG